MNSENTATARKLVLTALFMFGFGFAMWPIYNVFCDITGFNGKTKRLTDAEVFERDFDPNRLITVQFDGTVNSALPWEFRPKVLEMKVHPGEMTDAFFVARNTFDRAIVGNAVPSVAPAKASLYFNKTECFCFSEQMLMAGEQREMPLKFIIDPAIPDDVKVLTLSYTFFINKDATDRLATSGQAASRPALQRVCQHV